MNHFESHPESNRVGHSDDPGILAIADQNKAAALDLIRNADTFFVAALVPTQDGGSAMAASCCIKSISHDKFFDEVLVSINQMVEETDEELGDAA